MEFVSYRRGGDIVAVIDCIVRWLIDCGPSLAVDDEQRSAEYEHIQREHGQEAGAQCGGALLQCGGGSSLEITVRFAV